MMSFWNELPQPFFVLAPMEAVTDVVFRRVIAAAGAPDVWYTEFANATGWVHAGERAIGGRLAKHASEHPIVAQIWGGEPGDMEQFAAHCRQLGFDGIDINMGCPAKSAIKSGGAALIRKPDVAVAAIAAAKTAGLPVSVKTRLGYTYVDEWREWLTTLLQQDIVTLTVHLRTKKEMSKVPAHHELIADIIALRDEIAPHTLLVVNGDIRDRAHGEQLARNNPGLNGVMIGRGVFANPFCFRKHEAVSAGNGAIQPSSTQTRSTQADLTGVLVSLLPERQSLRREDSDSSSQQATSLDTNISIEEEDDGLSALGCQGDEASCTSRNEDCPSTASSAVSESQDTSSTLRSTTADKPASSELLSLLHLQLDLYDEYQSVTGRPYETLKRYFKIYVRDFDGASSLRDQLMHTTTTAEARAVLRTVTTGQ